MFEKFVNFFNIQIKSLIIVLTEIVFRWKCSNVMRVVKVYICYILFINGNYISITKETETYQAIIPTG